MAYCTVNCLGREAQIAYKKFITVIPIYYDLLYFLPLRFSWQIRPGSAFQSLISDFDDHCKPRMDILKPQAANGKTMQR